MSDRVADVVPEPVVEESEPPSPTERVWQKALAKYKSLLAADNTFGEPVKRVVVCVICGCLATRRGNKPVQDDHGIQWCLCPNGCEPPDDMGVDATMVPLSSRRGTVFDVWKLSPGDFMGPTEEELAERAREESVSASGKGEGDAGLEKRPEPHGVCDRYGQPLGVRWVPAPRTRLSPRY